MVRKETYREALRTIRSMMADDADTVAAMATSCAVLKQALPHLYWIGYYRVTREGWLQIGPYQGTPGCLHIEFGHGVVGTCAKGGESLLIRDVRAVPNHIACDPASRCEVVVPVRDGEGRIHAVLDADCTQVGGLDEEDLRGLEAVAELIGSRIDGPGKAPDAHPPNLQKN